MPPMTSEAKAAFFRTERQIEPSCAIVTPPADKRYQARFAAPDLARAFESLHPKHANLPIVTVALNLALNSRNRIRPAKNPVVL